MYIVINIVDLIAIFKAQTRNNMVENDFRKTVKQTSKDLIRKNFIKCPVGGLPENLSKDKKAAREAHSFMCHVLLG